MTRCDTCQIGVRWCICPYRDMAMPHAANVAVDFCLILHRNETMKPTNTGRLIGDLLPHNTHAYLWNRTAPDPLLLNFLAAREDTTYLVFPASYCKESDAPNDSNDTQELHMQTRRIVDISTIPKCPRPTFILLDGTWKQARKMFHMGEWMKQIPIVRFDLDSGSSYQLRQGSNASQVSTLEAAAGLLELTGNDDGASVMRDYFAVFNEHYAASRQCRSPQRVDAMDRLANRMLADSTDCTQTRMPQSTDSKSLRK